MLWSVAGFLEITYLFQKFVRADSRREAPPQGSHKAGTLFFIQEQMKSFKFMFLL